MFLTNTHTQMVFLCSEPNLPYPLFAPNLATAIESLGIPARSCIIGSNKGSRLLANLLPNDIGLAHTIPAFMNYRLFSSKLLHQIQPNDIVIVYETFGLTSRFSDGWFHKQVKRRGAKLLSLIQDAWPIVDEPLHRSACALRAGLSDLVGAVTPQLVSLLKHHYGLASIDLMEEAIDTENFLPDFSRNEPVVIWSGPPPKLKEVTDLFPVLEKVYSHIPFRLRIASGSRRPTFETNIPIDWVSFLENRPMQFGPASIGFAPYPDTAYTKCKGNYKVKTYLAAGCAVVTSPVGYNLDMITPNVHGLFASTPDEWEAAFLRLLRNPEERLAMRRAARNTAIRRFSYDAIARQYVQVLRRNGLIGS